MRSKAAGGKSCDKPGRFRDMFFVVQEIITTLSPPPSLTLFRLDEREILQDLVSQIRRDCPRLATQIVGPDLEVSEGCIVTQAGGSLVSIR